MSLVEQPTIAELREAADTSFTAKMRYWRQSGHMGVARPSDGWSDQPSIGFRRNEIIESAKANGYDPVPTDDNARWI